jgi:translation initiation factor IF-2
MSKLKTQDVIYKILEKLDETLDENNPDFTDLSPESLGISKERRNYILEMMQDAGLIKGVNFVNGGRNRAAIMAHINNMKITLRGIEYLAENSSTAKILRAAKEIKDLIPGI